MTRCPARPARSARQPIKAEPSGLTSGTTYHYRFKVTNENGTNFGGDREFMPAYVLKVKTLPATSIAEDEVATLNGPLDPDGIATQYYFEYGVDTNYGQKTATTQRRRGSGVTNVDQRDRKPAVREGVPLPDRHQQRERHDGGVDQVFRHCIRSRGLRPRGRRT